MTTNPNQSVKQEWAVLADVQHFLPVAVWQAVTERATQLLQQTGPEPASPTSGQSAQSIPRPLVKRLGTTPQPLSDLFIVN